jgi:hypothetical protein
MVTLRLTIACTGLTSAVANPELIVTFHRGAQLGKWAK